MNRYEEIVLNIEKSRNPLVRSMVENSKGVVNKYVNLNRTELSLKEKLNSVLSNCIVRINYTHDKSNRHPNGGSSNYICTTNKYFISLLSSRKYSEFLKVNDIEKMLPKNRPTQISAWNLVTNRPVSFVISRTKWDPFTIMEIRINESNIAVIEENFKNIIQEHRKTLKDENKIESKEIGK